MLQNLDLGIFGKKEHYVSRLVVQQNPIIARHLNWTADAVHKNTLSSFGNCPSSVRQVI